MTIPGAQIEILVAANVDPLASAGEAEAYIESLWAIAFPGEPMPIGVARCAQAVQARRRKKTLDAYA